MKENKAIFTCDSCEKKHEVSGISEHSTTFPYSEGWKYLYNLEIKVNGIKKVVDKHFCSNNCMIKFITKWIKEQNS